MHLAAKLSFAALTAALSSAAIGGQTAPSPYTLAKLTPVEAMPEGDWDQLAADVEHGRLYVSGEKGGLMEVFDLLTGALLASGNAVGSPHMVVFDKKAQQLLVADGTDGTVKVLRPNLSLVKSIPVGAKPDTGVIDAQARIFYVSSRDGDINATGSRVNAISLDTLEVVKTYALPAATLKGLTIDTVGKRLFVSMRDKNAVGVIHLATGQVESWNSAGLNKNVPLAFDARSRRLFVGSREPGKLIVLDATTGKPQQSLPATETADSMTFDPASRMLYVSGDTGMSRYRVATDGSVTDLGTDASLVGKTSLYVAARNRLYVMRPRKGQTLAALQVFDVKGR